MKQKKIQSNKNICPVCKKNFSTNGNLKKHYLTIHENIRPFKCPFLNCNGAYSNKARLIVHLRTHTGEKPFKCPQCFMEFNERGNLKTHIEYHKNIRPFLCTECDRAYKTKGHLKEHIETYHMKIRKFMCDICHKNFGSKCNLVAHIRTHNREKNYKCLLLNCSKKFTEKGNMLIHYRNHLIKMESEVSKQNPNKSPELYGRPILLFNELVEDNTFNSGKFNPDNLECFFTYENRSENILKVNFFDFNKENNDINGTFV